MLSNNTLIAGLSVAIWTIGASACAGSTEIGCPPTHDGKPLVDVSVFYGPPAGLAELIPRNGGWDLPGLARSPTLPDYTLGCTYRGSKDMVTVVLPRYIRVCEFPNYPQVRCH